MASIQGPRFNVDFFNKVGSLYNRFSGWCSEQEEKVSQGIQWVGEKAGEAWDAATSLTKNTIQSFIDNPVENLVKIGSGATILCLTAASFGTLSAVAALLGNTAAAAYGGATVYGIYEYKNVDKKKGEEDLKKVALSAITMAGAFGAQGNMNVTSTPGGNVQSNGSMALEGGHLIGYSIVLEGVTSISSEVTDALGITQSAIANGGGSSGTTGEKEKGDSETKVDDIVDKIPDKYKQNGQCDSFAEKLTEQLKKQGIDHEIVRIHSEYSIYSDKAGDVIGNGYHYGVRVGDTIYDNMTPGGIGFDSWLDDLGLTSQPKEIINWSIVDEILHY